MKKDTPTDTVEKSPAITNINNTTHSMHNT